MIAAIEIVGHERYALLAMNPLLAYLETYFRTAFWQLHGIKGGIALLLLAVTFPRVTLFFALSLPFGPLAWAGWFFVPRLTMAIFATMLYWKTNPEICVLSWLAILVSGSEYDLERRILDKCLKAISERWDDIKPLIVLPAKALVLIAIALIAAWTLLKFILGIPATNAITVGILAIIACASSLYFLRQRAKHVYGIFEIVSALMLGGYSIWRAVNFRFVSLDDLRKQPDFFGIVLGLLSSVYIVVRGLDNIGADQLMKSLLVNLKSKLRELNEKFWD